MSEPTPSQRRRVRRAPKFPQFMIVGGLLGALFGLVAALRGDSGHYSDAAAVGLFILIFGALGVLLGAVVAVLLDRRSLR